MRRIFMLFIGVILSACSHVPATNSGFVIDCRNGQQWSIPSTVNDERDFMKELAKCPGAIKLPCDTKAACDYAPVFIPWQARNGVIQPMTQTEIDRYRP